MIAVNGSLVRNFTLDEMANKSATNTCKLVLTPENVQFAIMVQALRSEYGKPLTVNSWYRTADFNRKIGGHYNSIHLDGRAVDLAVPDHATLDLLVNLWKKICFANKKIGGANLYPTFIHLDDYENKFGYTEFVLRDKR